MTTATARVPVEELPIVEELGSALEPEQAFLRLANLPHCLFLDSARRDPLLGRYSFVAADPFEYFEFPVDTPDALGVIREHLGRFQTPTRADCPPFQGGAAGLLSYDLGRSLERLPATRFDEFQAPAVAVGLYDVVVAFDATTRRSWIISQGFPEMEPALRRRRAQERLEQFRAQLAAPMAEPPGRAPIANSVDVAALAPQYPLDDWPGITSNFSRQLYLEAVGRTIDYIRAGDVFQVNISQRLLCPARMTPVELYMRLRRRNPATFGAYFDLGPFQIVSASPERFLRVVQGEVEARPIKGTRPRTARPEADLFAGDDLRQSEKDRAENVMIVDLLRNDLARVCRPDSVQVTQLCRLELYEYVQHLVSAVCGTLEPARDALDLVAAAFPGGSVTGAPKIRAMQIIAELEPTARGPYCGALGYVGFDGSMDTSILIRTITAGRGWWQAPVGGGIVAQSVPEREYEETWHKAEGLLRAMG